MGAVPRAIFLSLNALGDTLCITPALQAFRRQNPKTSISVITQAAPFTRVLDGNPDIDLLLYSERMYLNGLPEQRKEWIATLPLGLRERATLYNMDLRAAVTKPEDFRQHISKAFARIVGIETETVRPVMALDQLERRAASLLASRPYAVLSWHSVSNPKRDDGDGRKKDWPMDRWQELARRISTEAGLEVFAIGSERDAFPSLRRHITPLYGLPVKVVAALLEQAACVVTLENGIAHLAAAVDAPMVEIYSDMMPKEWAFPAESTACRVLYGNPHETDLDQVWAAMEEVLAQRGVAAR